MSRFGHDPIPGMPEQQAPTPGAPSGDVESPATAPTSSAPAPADGPAPDANRPIVALRVLNGPWAGDLIDVPDGDCDLLIGRNDPPSVVVDIDLTDAELGKPPMVSRRHAQVRRDSDGVVTVEDIGSTNGTWVDRVRQRPGEPSTRIADGTLLRFANIELVAVAAEGGGTA